MAHTVEGLEGVVVAETELSDVDGERGELIVRGHRIESLVGHVTFEQTVALLWTGVLPDAHGNRTWQQRLGAARARAFTLIPSTGDAMRMPDGMDALRAALAHLTASGDFQEDALLATGAAAVFAAAWVRARRGAPPVQPDASLPHGADFLRMMAGSEPAAANAAAVDAYLCCVVDHGLNASTLAARVVASTGSDLVSAVVAGVGALKGPLHGGAPGPVLDMLDAIRSAERARGWLRERIAAGERIMGMGHRIYRVRDPRAAALEHAAAQFERTGRVSARLTLARAVEREAEALLAERYPGRNLRANVEFYTAVLLEAAGIPRDAFSPTFAASRIVGWCAHVDEQRRRGRLMRPLSKYVGPQAAA